MAPVQLTVAITGNNGVGIRIILHTNVAVPRMQVATCQEWCLSG